MSIHHRTERKTAVGILITTALFLVMVAIIIVGGQQGFLKRHYELRTRMDRVGGLQSGAPVRLSGVDVGNVSEVTFVPDTSGKTKVEIVMKIKSGVQSLIKTDSEARISTLGLLGDKYVEITLGSPDSAALQNGDYIKSTSPIDFEELISRGVGAAGDVTEIVHAFKEISQKINRGQGTLGKLVNDPLLYLDISTLAKDIQFISEKIRRNEGTIGRFFNDTTLFVSMKEIFDGISSLVDTFQQSKGTLKQLLRDTTLYHKMNAMVSRMDSLVAEIRTGGGTTGALIKDRELYDELRKTVGGLDSLINDIKENPSKYLKVKVSIF